MKYVAVLPFVVPHYKDSCLSRCKLEDVLVLDNTERNRGVMRSHNLGIDFMRAQDADGLIIMSAAIRFGPPGGLDFLDELAKLDGDRYAVINAVGLYGWHLMAFPRQTIEAVGRWDENFHPYGFDDNDYAIRIRKARPDALWRGVKVDVTDTIMGHSIKLAGVRADAPAQLHYFDWKWGHQPGVPFEDYHDRPFGDPNNAVGYWPPPHDLDPVVDGARWDQPLPEPLPEAR